MTRPPAKIVVLGSFNMDITVVAPTLPKAGETVLGTDRIQSPGGKGSNQAIAAARLGAHVNFIGAVGADGFGQEARQTQADEGIDTTYLAKSTLPTGTALIIVDAAGENQIAVAPGANGTVSVAQVQRAERIIAEADVLLCQLETPVASFIAAAQIARDAGTLVLLNPAPFAPLPDEVWSLIDVITPNEHELSQLERSLAADANNRQAMFEQGLTAIVVTKGGAGVTVVTEAGNVDIASVPVEVVDTTGAGDAFNAGLAVALAEGASVENAAAFAVRVGACAVRTLGVFNSLPTRAEVEALV